MLACCRVTCKRRFSPAGKRRRVCAGPYWDPVRVHIGNGVVPECGAAWQPREGPRWALPAGSHQVTGRRHRRRMAAAVGFTRAATPHNAMQQGSHPASEVFLAPCTTSHDSPLTTAAETIKARYEIRPPSESMRSS